MAKYISLQFSNSKDSIDLEYIPEKLSFSDRSSANTIPTIGGSTSFIPQADSVRTDLNIVARVYQANKPDDILAEQLAGVGAGVGAAIGLQFVSETAFNTARNSILLARGVYDVAGDVLASTNALGLSQIPAKGIDKINILRENMKNGVSCTVNWDLDQASSNVTAQDADKTRYILISLDVQAITIQEETLTTIAYELNMSFVNEGNNRVEVKNA